MSEALDLYPDDSEMAEDGLDVREGDRTMTAQQWVQSAIGNPNLAFDMDPSILAAMGAKVCEEYDIDLASRQAAGYEEKLERAVKIASLTRDAKNTPWPNASNVKYPLIIQAAIQFNARSYSALVDGPSVVKVAVKGRSDERKQSRAERIGKHMSWQLLDEMEEWEEDTDSLLLRLPIVGTLVRKVYFDPLRGHNCSHVVGPEDFVVNYRASRDLTVCPRATHRLWFYPYEVTEKRRGGLWLDVDIGQANDAANDDEAPHEFLEQYRLWDVDGDGYPEPYIITVHRESQRVVRVVARWYEDGILVNDRNEIVRIKPYEVFAKYGFIPSPDGSFYDIGFGILLGSLSDTIDTTLNQLMDAATLANMQGGWIGDGVSMKSGNMSFRPGEWKRATSSAGTLRDSIVPLPTKEPSSVLYQLMAFLIDTARDLTATQDILTGDAGSANMPVGTVQALVEQGLKAFSAIVKRIHRAFKRELQIQYALNARYLEPEVYFTFQDEPVELIREDYAENDLDVIPVSDPNMATDMQRMSQAQFLMQFMNAPGMNPKEIITRALNAAKVTDIEKLFAPAPSGPPEPDPKTQAEMAKVELMGREVEIKAGVAAADIAAKNAQTAKLEAELAAMGPDMAAFVDQQVREGIRAALAMVEDGGQPQADQGDVPGMGGAPNDTGIQGAPEGQPGPSGGPMGEGFGDEPFPTDQGIDPSGAIDPQLG